MNFFKTNNGSCYSNTCPQSCPTYDNCNQVVQTCNVEEVPHYVNYHTHVVNNCIKRHVNVPTYSSDAETVIINEYVDGNPIYYQPNMQQGSYMPGYQQPTYQGPIDQTAYQGNVGNNPVNQFNNFMNQGGNPQGFNSFGF